MNLAELDAEGIAGLRKLCMAHDGESCESSFANLFLYAEVENTRILPYRDGAVILFPGENVIMPPFGMPELPPEELSVLCRQCGAVAVYDAAPGYDLRFPECGEFFETETTPDEADYIYSAAKLVENSGARLRKKRNLIRQFEELYFDNRVEAITPENIAEAVAFAEMCNSHLVQAGFLRKENTAMERAARFFELSGLRGIILYAGNRKAGFSLFSRIGSSKTWDVHFEKADHELKGAPQRLTQAAAEAVISLGGEFMNREQDLGEPGLRHAKESLDPDHLYRRMLLRLKS